MSIAPKTMSAEHDLIDLPNSLRGPSESRLSATRVGPIKRLYAMVIERLPTATREITLTLINAVPKLSLRALKPLSPDEYRAHR